MACAEGYRTGWSGLMDLRYRWSRFKEKAMLKLVWSLPKKVVYWSAIRVIANATTGPHRNQVVPDLRAMDALDRWDKTHGH